MADRLARFCGAAPRHRVVRLLHLSERFRPRPPVLLPLTSPLEVLLGIQRLDPVADKRCSLSVGHRAADGRSLRPVPPPARPLAAGIAGRASDRDRLCPALPDRRLVSGRVPDPSLRLDRHRGQPESAAERLAYRHRRFHGPAAGQFHRQHPRLDGRPAQVRRVPLRPIGHPLRLEGAAHRPGPGARRQSIYSALQRHRRYVQYLPRRQQPLRVRRALACQALRSAARSVLGPEIARRRAHRRALAAVRISGSARLQIFTRRLPQRRSAGRRPHLRLLHCVRSNSLHHPGHRSPGEAGLFQRRSAHLPESNQALAR